MQQNTNDTSVEEGEAAELQAKITAVENASRQFKRAAAAIAKKQHVLLSHVQQLLDEEKIHELTKTLTK